jgi:hypothetical protein
MNEWNRDSGMIGISIARQHTSNSCFSKKSSFLQNPLVLWFDTMAPFITRTWAANENQDEIEQRLVESPSFDSLDDRLLGQIL